MISQQGDCQGFEAKPTVFVCGPITCAIADGEFDPRVRSLLMGVSDLLEKSGFRILSAHREELWGESIPADPAQVFRRDWRLAQAADAIVAVLPADRDGKLYRTDGTFIELGWAVASRKPLFVLTDPGATDRSYLFDGLLETSACDTVFNAGDPGSLVDALPEAIRRRLAPAGPKSDLRLAFCCTSFGFGPVSKTVAVAQAVRRLRPSASLVFAGADISLGYAASAGAFDELLTVDPDSSPAACLSALQGADGLVNCLSFDVLEQAAHSADSPPQFFVDSLGWMWTSPPEAIAHADRYLVQDYLLDTRSTKANLPPNAVVVPPILSPAVNRQRVSWEVEKGHLLVHLGGCRNPLLSPTAYQSYVNLMLTGLATALAGEAGAGVQQVTVCGNEELLRAASPVDWPEHLRVHTGFLPHEEFLRELRRCEQLFTTPGLTATLEALALGVPCRFLLPHNYSQQRIVTHYKAMGAADSVWPDSLVSELLEDESLGEEAGVHEVARLLEEYLDDGPARTAAAFRALLKRPVDHTHTELLRSRALAWDGSSRVAHHVIERTETELHETASSVSRP